MQQYDAPVYALVRLSGDTMSEKIVGHKTFQNPDGSFRHEPLTESDGDRLWAECERRQKERAAKMPDEQAALKQLFEAYIRLKELGWNEAIYCPKDGSMFSAIEAGSTGIHECNYTGEWPDGSWNIYDGDMWSAYPILWRSRKDTDPVVNRGPCTMGLEKA